MNGSIRFGKEVVQMKKILIALFTLILTMILVPAGAFAAEKTVKSTMYEIFKSGKTVFVTGSQGLYKVKLRNGKPVSKKKLVKPGKDYGFDHFLIKGKYIYFKKSKGSATSKVYLYRVKKTGGKAKKLATMKQFAEVAVKKKIYYTYPGDETDEDGMVLTTYRKVMKLNGSSKKNTDITAVEKDKYYNVKGYKFAFKATKKYVITYLKTPKGKIALEKQKI